ncbi:MAG: RecX family transcriptional regulator [Deltaproteobacteria bacterium]|nr:RecX family transcriptional regulator [Deltaproteobacteria bacterium]
MRRRREAGGHEDGEAARVPVRTAALDILARRRCTAAEIERRLGRAGYGEPEIAEAVAWLRDLRYVDDEAVAGEIACAGASRRNWGPGRVAVKLRARGIDRETASRAVAGAFEGVDMRASARAALRRRFGRADFSGEGPRERKRASDFLYRSGFDWDTIREVLKARSDHEA